MFMHMPKKLGIPVMLAVAAAVGTYYWYIMNPVRIGDWEIYQGSGRVERGADGQECLVITGTVRCGKPIFAWRGTLNALPAGVPPVLVVEYQSETALPELLLATARAEGEANFYGVFAIEKSEAWKYATSDAQAVPVGRISFAEEGKYPIHVHIRLKVRPPRLAVGALAE